MPNQTYPASEPMPNSVMATTTPSEAPALMPRIRGSASGLRVNAWSSTPAAARAAPTTRPSSVRGTRRSQTMVAASPPSGATSACHTRPMLSGLLPTARLASTTRTSNAAPASNTNRRRTRVLS